MSVDKEAIILKHELLDHNCNNRVNGICEYWE